MHAAGRLQEKETCGSFYAAARDESAGSWFMCTVVHNIYTVLSCVLSYVCSLNYYVLLALIAIFGGSPVRRIY
jgi:hypothetical protein